MTGQLNKNVWKSGDKITQTAVDNSKVQVKECKTIIEVLGLM